jgi:hypothetical protein
MAQRFQPSNSSGSATVTDDPVQTLRPGISVQWLHNREIIAMSTEDSQRDSVDCWCDHIMERIREWPSDKPVLVMVDLSSPRVVPTPYTRSRAKDIAHVRSDLKMYAAMVVKRSFMMQLVMPFTRRPMTSYSQIRMFFSRDEALTWLRGIAEQNGG